MTTEAAHEALLYISCAFCKDIFVSTFKKKKKTLHSVTNKYNE